MLKKCVILLLLAFFNAILLNGQQTKEICITVDDLPTVPYGMRSIETDKGITRQLVDKLVRCQVPAIGYVNEGKLYNGESLMMEKIHLLEYWLKNGLELGNHTYSHINYHESTTAAFFRNIDKGEIHLRPLLRQYNQELRYFRHPYLRIGETKEKAVALESYLHEKGYTAAPVTIDNEDYIFAKVYSLAVQKNDGKLQTRIAKDYIDYMMAKVKHFEHKTHRLFHRPIKHILLVHASLLNAHHLDKLLRALKAEGYTFISQTEALTDPAYETEIVRYGPWGISWIDRWAMTYRKNNDFYDNEPEVPEYIMEMY